MHAYLLIGGENKLDPKINKLLKELSAQRHDIELQKIADVRNLTSQTKIKQREKICYVIKEFNSATMEAQNAFLKSLEEPPENISFILTAPIRGGILPTILSRCQVIFLKPTRLAAGNQKSESFVKASLGEKLKIASTINKRDEAINFLNSLLIFYKTKGQELEATLETLRRIEGNANVQLQLTNLVTKISLP